MATKSIEDTWADTHRQIEELEARAERGDAHTRARLRERIDGLIAEEAAAHAAVREKAEAVDERLRQLEIDIAIAESRLASELADDAASFAEAVEAELQHWDAAIERLQTRVATGDQRSREQAEAEIAALRQARNGAAERLAALRASSDEEWQGLKSRVTEALDDLERKLREAAAKFNKGGRHDH